MHQPGFRKQEVHSCLAVRNMRPRGERRPAATGHWIMNKKHQEHDPESQPQRIPKTTYDITIINHYVSNRKPSVSRSCFIRAHNRPWDPRTLPKRFQREFSFPQVQSGWCLNQGFSDANTINLGGPLVLISTRSCHRQAVSKDLTSSSKFSVAGARFPTVLWS